MTYQDVIEDFKDECNTCFKTQAKSSCRKCKTFFIISAIARQIPKKPVKVIVIKNEHSTHWHYECPICGSIVTELHGCSSNDCRQALDWSEG